MLLKNPQQKSNGRLANRVKGTIGESVASKYLLDKGYTIIEKNFSTRFGEIDIVAKRPNGIVAFVEVKARMDITHGLPYESVTWGKRKRLTKTIQYYLLKKHLTDSKLAFEVVSIIFKNYSTVESIQHFEDAPLEL